MKKNIMPLVLMILIVSLLFTACGGDDGRLAALEEENAALKAQLAELEGKIAEMEQTTPEERAWSSKYFVDGEFTLPTDMVAESPANIEEFCGIAWGEGYDSLFVDPHANVVEQKAIIYGGNMGSAFYVFTDGGLSKGQIAFYSKAEKSDTDIFIELYAYLVAAYGEPMGALEGLNAENLDNGGSLSAVWVLDVGEKGKVQLSLMGGVSPQSPLAGTTALWFSLK